MKSYYNQYTVVIVKPKHWKIIEMFSASVSFDKGTTENCSSIAREYLSQKNLYYQWIKINLFLLISLGLARLSVTVGRGWLRRHQRPPVTSGQGLETGYRLVQQVSLLLLQGTCRNKVTQRKVHRYQKYTK